ncbi:MAG: hypothetical protein HN742_29120 [Lentisphaerae bacterium]|jgi:hypothetical protein|nr:hypothetical protein [Lentisphaerota bacterium]MBT4820891.1 hypothetical protein [Lentisphaerota bacterium]MBT5612475.1 hypothetical protein [Lentisphaerota bacterium]MBT7061902.1 hypothetical protein [Lentisphaerota bacterium]MBT7845970.1 hypothetical protein [Lentisphaerota bacterium]
MLWPTVRLYLKVLKRISTTASTLPVALVALLYAFMALKQLPGTVAVFVVLAISPVVWGGVVFGLMYDDWLPAPVPRQTRIAAAWIIQTTLLVATAVLCLAALHAIPSVDASGALAGTLRAFLWGLGVLNCILALPWRRLLTIPLLLRVPLMAAVYAGWAFLGSQLGMGLTAVVAGVSFYALRWAQRQYVHAELRVGFQYLRIRQTSAGGAYLQTAEAHADSPQSKVGIGRFIMSFICDLRSSLFMFLGSIGELLKVAYAGQCLCGRRTFLASGFLCLWVIGAALWWASSDALTFFLNTTVSGAGLLEQRGHAAYAFPVLYGLLLGPRIIVGSPYSQRISPLLATTPRRESLWRLLRWDLAWATPLFCLGALVVSLLPGKRPAPVAVVSALSGLGVLYLVNMLLACISRRGVHTAVTVLLVGWFFLVPAVCVGMLAIGNHPREQLLGHVTVIGGSHWFTTFALLFHPGWSWILGRVVVTGLCAFLLPRVFRRIEWQGAAMWQR